MVDFAYAVHTDFGTYLLDDTGICIWVLSANTAAASKLAACVGAQFVACVDSRVEGCIVGELKEGSSALLVATSQETGRAQLLRTGLIRSVQYRDADVTGENAASLDVVEEVELELLEDSQVTALPTDPKRPGQEARNAASAQSASAREAKNGPDKSRAEERAGAPRPAQKAARPQAQAPVAHRKGEADSPPASAQPKSSGSREQAAARPARHRPTAPELAGLPAPKKPTLSATDPDATQRFSPRGKKR